MSDLAQATTGSTRPDRRAVRRQASKDEIVDAARDLVRENGLAGLAMRDLGERVGMKAQSIYSYFGSKHEIYDAMFHQGYAQFVTAMSDTSDTSTKPPESDEDRRVVARRGAHCFFDFCVSDPVRYQLLFQRTIPGFEPSERSWAVATQAYEAMAAQLAACGVTDTEHVDMWTALLTGLTDQQISNDPGGDRWERLIDRSLDMFLHEVTWSHANSQSEESTMETT